MSLAHLATILFFLLFGINALGWVAVSASVLGIVALIVAILYAVESYRPFNVWPRRNVE